MKLRRFTSVGVEMVRQSTRWGEASRRAAPTRSEFPREASRNSSVANLRIDEILDRTAACARIGIRDELIANCDRFKANFNIKIFLFLV